MNNFNSVFMAIKARFNNDEISVDGGFEDIARDAKVPEHSIEFYLNCLSDIGLITYSKPNRRITLTELGKKRDGLFNS